jgi:hypothetical protein
MITNEIKDILLCCTAINYLILGVWFGVFCLAHDWLYQLHVRWFSLTDEAFDKLHYAGMSIYKIEILLFNITPLIALYIVAR